MPSDNVTRAIKKGTGELEGGAAYESHTYEGYGPFGVAVMIEVLSDNKNRTVSDLRHQFTKFGGALAEAGAVAWMFEHKGVIKAVGSMTEDQLLEKLFDYNIDDLRLDDGLFTITCRLQDLDIIKKAVDGLGLKVESAQPEWVAKNPLSLGDRGQEETVFKFLDALDDLDDVQNVYANLGD